MCNLITIEIIHLEYSGSPRHLLSTLVTLDYFILSTHSKQLHNDLNPYLCPCPGIPFLLLSSSY